MCIKCILYKHRGLLETDLCGVDCEHIQLVNVYLYNFNGKIEFKQVQTLQSNWAKKFRHINMGINKNYYKIIKTNKDMEKRIHIMETEQTHGAEYYTNIRCINIGLGHNIKILL